MEQMLQRLLESRNRAWEQAKAFLDRADENGKLSTEDDAAFNRANDEVSELDARIQELYGRYKANKQFEENKEEFDRVINPAARAAAERREQSQFRRLFAGEIDNINLDFRALHRYVDPRTGMLKIEPRAALGEDAAAAGGNTVPTDFLNQLYQHMIHLSAIRQTNVRILATSDGRPIELPKTVSFGTAALSGEGSAIAGTDPSFGQLTMNAWKYGRVLHISNELLTDTGVDIEGFIAQDLGRDLGQVTGAALVTGDGSNKPRGVVTAVAADAGTAVQIASATVEVDNLIDLFYSPIRPYREQGFWFMADSTEKSLRKKKNANDEYVWQPSIIPGAPNTLLGRPVVVDPNMPAIASAAKSVVFGDFSGYVIREAGGVQIATTEDLKFAEDQRSYRATLRIDGDLLDANALDCLDTD